MGLRLSSGTVRAWDADKIPRVDDPILLFALSSWGWPITLPAQRSKVSVAELGNPAMKIAESQ